MNKSRIIAILLAALMVMLMLTGCGKDSGREVSGSDAAEEYEEITGDPALHASASEDKIPQFDFCHLYGDIDKAQTTWLWCECNMRNVKLISVTRNTLTSVISPNEVIYEFGDVYAGEAVLLFLDIPELNPTYALTYNVGREERTYVIGYDKETGTATLTQIGNEE